MNQAHTFCGLVGVEDEVSVVVQQLAVPVADVLPGLRPQALEERGMFLLGQESTPIAGAPGLLLHITQPREDQTFVKWVGVTGDDQRTILITAAFAKDSSPVWSTILREVVLTAEPASNALVYAEEPSLGHVQPEPSFAMARQNRDQLIYTPGGTFPLVHASDPLFVVARGSAAVALDDRAEFARQRAGRLEGVQQLEIESTSAVAIDGLEGYEVLGQTATNLQQQFVLSTMLFEADAYFLLVGLSAAERRGELEPVFRRMTASFQRAAKR